LRVSLLSKGFSSAVSGYVPGDFMTVKALVNTAEEGGFWAEVPALPGCVTQGETIEELRVNLEDAIKLWFEAGEPESMTTEGDQIVVASSLPVKEGYWGATEQSHKDESGNRSVAPGSNRTVSAARA
jgi:predicted RNase H-like HicB family nuclease